MYDQHAEHTAIIDGSVDHVFALLDDQTRLSGHMEQRSWKMGWGKMEIVVDERRGRAVGSHMILRGRVLGIRLQLDEVVTQREPPHRKVWETVGDPRLLVIGPYRMGFELASFQAKTRVRVEISYRLPERGIPWVLGRLFGRAYATWCVTRMAEDARLAFARESHASLPQT
jgi:uncharacterized membrane protein